MHFLAGSCVCELIYSKLPDKTHTPSFSLSPSPSALSRRSKSNGERLIGIDFLFTRYFGAGEYKPAG